MEFLDTVESEPSISNATSSKVDVLIIGAGISGLTSAIQILTKERSLTIKILEATNTIGGQIGSSHLGQVGAKWITEDQYHIYQLMQHWKIPMRRRTEQRNALKRCWDVERGFFGAFASYELNRFLRELELKVQQFRPGRFNLESHYMSMHRLICRRLFFNKSRKFMRNLVQLISGVDPRDISYKEFMSICYTCGGLKTLMELYLECPNTLIEISSEELVRAYLKRLGPTQVLVWRKVHEIRHFKEYVEVCDSEYEVHTASAVIVAIPWNKLEEISITPSMPMELRKPPLSVENSRKMMTSFLAKYNESHWRTRGYSGDFLSSEPFIIGHEYRANIYFGLMMHEEGLQPLVRGIALEALAKQMGEEMLLPIDYSERSFEMSCSVNKPFTTPWNRIVWSSSAAAATCYRGCLGGAVQSGLRAAMNAMLVVRPQVVSWQDIAEIQCSDSLKLRRISWTTLWLSSWNLYNVGYYSLFVCGIILLLRQFYNRN